MLCNRLGNGKPVCRRINRVWCYVGIRDSSYSSANVTASTNGGGLIGYTIGYTLTECYSTGNFLPTSTFLQSYSGGFIGYAGVGTTINRCYSTGNVNPASTSNVNYLGGFAGAINGTTIQDCYSTGTLYGNTFLGGFVSLNYSSSSPTQSTISRCYSKSQITAQNPPGAGGFSYSSGNLNVSASYWDTEISGYGTSGTATGKTTSEMKTQGTFSGWSFPDTWKIDAYLNGGYPFLAYQTFYNINVSVSSISTSPMIISQSSIAFTAQTGTVSLSYQENNSTPSNLPGGAVTIGKYWEVGSITGGSIKLRLYYTTAQKASFTGTPKIYHYTGSQWEELPTDAEVVNGSTRYVETTNYYSSFSPVTVGDGNNPLPVELTSFTASALNRVINLRWATTTEVNNYGFEIQRTVIREQGSANSDWDVVGFVAGNGNSNSPKTYLFADKNVSSGKYLYRLKQINTDGTFDYSKEIEITTGAPGLYNLSQNYPNPFNPSTTIEYTVPAASDVKIEVYDVLGKKVAELLNEKKEAGIYSVPFNGSSFPSGVYAYSIYAGEYRAVKKMTLIK